jgi:mannose-6-phosphate isomerase-like protein (cupin superfamily)
MDPWVREERMQVISGAGAYVEPAAGGAGNHWVEQLRVADLSVGTYSVRAGGTDDQVPHTEDEIYVVMSGQGVLLAGGDRAELGPGAVVFVAAHEEHRLTEITEDLAVLVLFAPAEGSRSGSGSESG